jgi:hypothetical protein
MALLDHLSEFSEQLDKKTVADKIWPHLVGQTNQLKPSDTDPSSPLANGVLRYCRRYPRSYYQVYYPTLAQSAYHNLIPLIAAALMSQLAK